MILSLPAAPGGMYTSRSQLARVRTEAWATRELYCLECTDDSLVALRAGTAVVDYSCNSCHANYQLKAKAGRFGGTIANSGYAKKIAAIRAGAAPNYMFLSYDPVLELVTDAFAIPGRYFSEDVIAARQPLGPNARRAGWIGSNILLGKISTLGRVVLVQEGAEISSQVARSHWAKLRFLDEISPRLRGWTNDVWTEIEGLGKRDFMLGELYQREAVLRAKHPENAHIRPKIRQQLQMLRDQGFVTFLGRGQYRIRGGPWAGKP